MKKISVIAVTVVGMIALVGSPAVYAATSANSQLSQAITAGALSTDVRSGTNTVVASPSFAMSSAVASTSVQTSTGTLGTPTQRLSVDNPGGANNGWTLAINATVPGTGNWTNGTQTYPYNGTSTTGQLTLSPNLATITPVTGGATGVTQGTSSAFTGSTPITIMTASSSAAKVWNGYMTGVGLSQVIPAGQAVGSYSLNLTQTVTAS